jgi:flagellin-like hook-associated protein FlgL
MTAAAVVAASFMSATAASAAPAANSDWSNQANKVCSVWLAKVKQVFATPITTAQLYPFTVKVKSMESAELAQLEQIPGRSASGTAALGAVKNDLSELDSAIAQYKQGNATQGAVILKHYLNDSRPKTAFKAAGATSCG